MPKLFLRIVVCFLVPCLLADSATSAILSILLLLPPLRSSGNLFSCQALAPQPDEAFRPPASVDAARRAVEVSQLASETTHVAHGDELSRAESTPEYFYIDLPAKFFPLITTLPNPKADFPENITLERPKSTNINLILVYKNNGRARGQKVLTYDGAKRLAKDLGMKVDGNTALDLQFRFGDVGKQVSKWSGIRQTPLPSHLHLEDYQETEISYDFKKVPELMAIDYDGHRYSLDAFRQLAPEFFADLIEFEEVMPHVFDGPALYRAVTDDEWDEIKSKGYMFIRSRDNFEENVGPQVKLYAHQKGYARVIVRIPRKGPYFIEAGFQDRRLGTAIPHFIQGNEIEVSETGESWQSLHDYLLSTAGPAADHADPGNAKSIKSTWISTVGGILLPGALAALAIGRGMDPASTGGMVSLVVLAVAAAGMAVWQGRDRRDMRALGIDAAGKSSRGVYRFNLEIHGHAIEARTNRHERFVHAISRALYRISGSLALESTAGFFEDLLIAPWADPVLSVSWVSPPAAWPSGQPGQKLKLIVMTLGLGLLSAVTMRAATPGNQFVPPPLDSVGALLGGFVGWFVIEPAVRSFSPSPRWPKSIWFYGTWLTLQAARWFGFGMLPTNVEIWVAFASAVMTGMVFHNLKRSRQSKPKFVPSEKEPIGSYGFATDPHAFQDRTHSKIVEEILRNAHRHESAHSFSSGIDYGGDHAYTVVHRLIIMVPNLNSRHQKTSFDLKVYGPLTSYAILKEFRDQYPGILDDAIYGVALPGDRHVRPLKAALPSSINQASIIPYDGINSLPIEARHGKVIEVTPTPAVAPTDSRKPGPMMMSFVNHSEKLYPEQNDFRKGFGLSEKIEQRIHSFVQREESDQSGGGESRKNAEKKRSFQEVVKGMKLSFKKDLPLGLFLSITFQLLLMPYFGRTLSVVISNTILFLILMILNFIRARKNDRRDSMPSTGSRWARKYRSSPVSILSQNPELAQKLAIFYTDTALSELFRFGHEDRRIEPPSPPEVPNFTVWRQRLDAEGQRFRRKDIPAGRYIGSLTALLPFWHSREVHFQNPYEAVFAYVLRQRDFHGLFSASLPAAVGNQNVIAYGPWYIDRNLAHTMRQLYLRLEAQIRGNYLYHEAFELYYPGTFLWEILNLLVHDPRTFPVTDKMNQTTALPSKRAA